MHPGGARLPHRCGGLPVGEAGPVQVVGAAGEQGSDEPHVLLGGTGKKQQV